MALQLERDTAATLADVIERILDKGLVINADITVSVVGVELLGIKVRAALASFETAARYGLEFPSGLNLEAPGWRQLEQREPCPACARQLSVHELLTTGCAWCGWSPARVNGRGLAHQEALPLETKAMTGGEA